MPNEYKCRDCGYVRKVVTINGVPDRFTKAGLCCVCYYSEGNGHECEEMCQFPGCEEVVLKGEFCVEHGPLVGGYMSIGKRAVAKAVRAMNRPAIADKWDEAGIRERAKLLMLAGVAMHNIRRCKSIQLPWEDVNPITQRRLAMVLDNVVI